MTNHYTLESAEFGVNFLMVVLYHEGPFVAALQMHKDDWLAIGAPRHVYDRYCNKVRVILGNPKRGDVRVINATPIDGFFSELTFYNNQNIDAAAYYEAAMRRRAKPKRGLLSTLLWKLTGGKP